jgi:hypothetical protein
MTLGLERLGATASGRRQRRNLFLFRFPLDHLGTRPGFPLGQHLLYQFDPALNLLVSHRLDPAGMLDLHLTRDKVPENLHITERAVLPTFLNRLPPMRVKIEKKRLEESLVKRVTCV